MSGDRLYQVLAWLLDAAVWGGDLIGKEALPESGPAVYVANHAGSQGPIAVAVSLPFRVFPWVVADMVDWENAPAYLQKDFVGPELHLTGALGTFLSRLLSQVSVRLLRRIECIPVWSDKGLPETYQLSEKYLEMGRSLLIFPEDPDVPDDPQSGMKPFKTGFARLGQIHFAATRQKLAFFPLAVLKVERQVRVGTPVVFNPVNTATKERLRIARLLESMIRRMVVGETTEVHAGVPFSL
jgi:hypothetical protein